MTAAVLPPLGHLQAGPVEGRETWSEYRGFIEAAIDNDPRSLQRAIGPSELGTPCDACLVLKLAGVEEKRSGGAWLPTVGKAVHQWLEDVFLGVNEQLGRTRFLVEARVAVGSVAGVEVTGSSDLFDLDTGTVTDWKITGDATQKKVKAAGDSLVYNRQKHLYGRGFARRGLTVTTVQTAYLPRNKPSLRDAVIVPEPYDEAIAAATVARADKFASWTRAIGLERVLEATGGHTGLEWSCSRFDASLAAPGRRPPSSQLDGLLTPSSPAAPRVGPNAA